MSVKYGVFANAIYTDAVISDTFIMFLKRIQKFYDKEAFVIYMDSLSAHISGLTSKYM